MTNEIDAGARRNQIVTAVGITALGLAIAGVTASMPSAPSYARVGPTLFPYAVAVALTVLGGLQVLLALRGGWAPAEESEDGPVEGPVDWRALGWLLLGLFLNVALIDTLGFILASTLMFVATARAFGSERPLRDAGVAILVCVVAYVGFDRLLGISIGAGVLGDLFDRVF